MHQQFLLLALEQARKGQGQCAPNPCVGAVAVQNGIIIAQAWHQGAGTPHAEQLLLAQFPPKTPGVTVYSTLEPCNHWGRTPPCVNALIEHGVEQVIFSFLDPNPVVASRNSTQLLQEQGIKVSYIPLQEIEAFYTSYRYWLGTQRPRVTVKMAQTFDGKIAGPKGARIQLSNALCGQFTQEQRAAADVILTTGKTVRLDNPKMNVRLDGKEYGKPVAILDTNLQLSGQEQIFSTAKHCHLYHCASTERAFTELAKSSGDSEVSFYKISQKDGTMDLSAVFAHLGSLGFHDVWVEAGGTLFSALHKQGLVHRTYLYLVPRNLGPDALSAYHQQGLLDRPHTITWQAMGDNMIACFDWQEDQCSLE